MMARARLMNKPAVARHATDFCNISLPVCGVCRAVLFQECRGALKFLGNHSVIGDSLQAGRAELQARLSKLLKAWSPMLQKFLRSHDDQAWPMCSFSSATHSPCSLGFLGCAAHAPSASAGP